MLESSTQTSTAQPGRYQFSYVGNGMDLALLLLKNLFLILITLGIYQAWAKTNMRRYLWENVQFDGDRGTYVGTGGELFRGWIKLFGILFAAFLVVGVLQAFLPFLKVVFSLAMPFIYLYIFSIAVYSGLRYRLSRTLWRQIRFGADKDAASSREFTIFYMKGMVLSFVTLGIYLPYFRNQMRTYLTNKSRLGDSYFKFDGKDDEYFALCIKGFFLTILTLGIYLPFFIAQMTKFRLSHTSFQQARFEFTLPGKELLIFGLAFYLGSIFTFGLAAPWLLTWGLRMFTENIYLNGAVDFASIKQRASDGSAMAEDIVGEYDLDLGF